MASLQVLFLIKKWNSKWLMLHSVFNPYARYSEIAFGRKSAKGEIKHICRKAIYYSNLRAEPISVGKPFIIPCPRHSVPASSALLRFMPLN